MDYIIRREEERDYFEVENVTREAFWNVYRPGCNEHLVTHNFRSKESFIKELDFVIEGNGEILGTIIYSHGILKLDKGSDKDFIAFGPVGIRPDMQTKGLGSSLIRYSLKEAEKMGYEAVFITGNPEYYKRFGFEPACRYSIYLSDKREQKEATFFMVKILKEGCLDGMAGIYAFDECFAPEASELEEFEKLFPPKVKEKRPGQFEE